jgi:SNF2 family DNA or RNA helicase
LTGTPFVNRADDIHSLLSFLKVEPLCHKDIYRRAISSPIQNGDDLGLTRLRVTMNHLALTRGKASTMTKLVDKQVQLTTVSFAEGSPHKAVYNALFGSFRMVFDAILQGGESEVLKNYSSVFEKLLRIRQTCCSALLVPSKRRGLPMELWTGLQDRKEGAQKLAAEEGPDLLEKVKGTFTQEGDRMGLPECAVCLTEMEEQQCVILRTCSHVYCEPCINRVVSDSTRAFCPLCRGPFGKSDMV